MRVNGQELIVKDEISLSEFLLGKGYDTDRVAVEKNGKIVRKGTFNTEMLSDDDSIEIVCFVGGG